MLLSHRLAVRERPIRVSIVGVGSIGNGLVHQAHVTPGFAPVAIADTSVEKALATAARLGLDPVVCETPEAASAAIASGKLAVAPEGSIVASADGVDAMIEASNAVYEGALHARAALARGQHVIMMNFEADLMYGPVLLAEATAKGLVYTAADGDQPTVIKRLLDDITFWGFEPVMLGNIKGYLDRYTDPTKIAPEADKRALDHKMCSSYTDGSKLCVEMACLANGLGGRVHVPGMIGPRLADIHDIYTEIDFAEIWAPGDPPLVDYVLGATPKGGVFIVAHTADPFQQFTMSWFPPDMGPGPHYLFYRPYHLGHIEALACVAEAVLDGTARLAPWAGMRTNVMCYAKRDLAAGEVIDGMGGYLTYGLIENLSGKGADPEPGLPQLISDGVRLTRPIAKDARIPLAACAADRTAPAFALYRAACGERALELA